MRTLLCAFFALMPLLGIAEQVQFEATDKGFVWADYFPNPPGGRPARAIVLMFHTDGGNNGEYELAVPKLVHQNFACLTVDTRLGNKDLPVWQLINRTTKFYPQPPPLEDVFYDIEGSYKWAKAKGYSKIICIGSVSSATMIVRLANKYGDVKGIVCCSPNPTLGTDLFKQDRTPTLLMGTIAEGNGPLTAIYEAIPFSIARGADDLLMNPNSVPGAVTLREDRNPAGAEFYWNGLWKFVNFLAPPP